MYRKKPKLNFVNEEVETIEVIDTDTTTKNNAPPTVIEEIHQPTTSNTQLIKKRHSVEMPSSNKPVEKEIDIMQKYREIKMKNEALKTNTYNQYWKKSPSDQRRLFSSFDDKTRKM